MFNIVKFVNFHFCSIPVSVKFLLFWGEICFADFETWFALMDFEMGVSWIAFPELKERDMGSGWDWIGVEQLVDIRRLFDLIPVNDI